LGLLLEQRLFGPLNSIGAITQKIIPSASWVKQSYIRGWVMYIFPKRLCPDIKDVLPPKGT
jgi:hypothetical protein